MLLTSRRSDADAAAYIGGSAGTPADRRIAAEKPGAIVPAFP